MTGKRFQWCGRINRWYVDEFVVDTFTNKELDEEDMCDLLNKQEERIQKLEDFIKVHVEGTVADEVL